MLYALTLLEYVWYCITPFCSCFSCLDTKNEHVVLHLSCVPIECTTRDWCRPWTRSQAQPCSLDVSGRVVYCYAIEYAQGTVDAIANRESM